MYRNLNWREYFGHFLLEIPNCPPYFRSHRNQIQLDNTQTFDTLGFL